MDKITIWGKDQLKEVIEKLPQEFRDNPSFEQIFIYPIESTLYWEKSPIEVTISDDYKQVRVVPKPKIDRDYNNLKTHMECTDFSLDDDNNIEIIKSEGELQNADLYYNKIGESKPDYKVTSVMDTYYSRTLIDKDGIEMARSTYYKSSWPLTGVEYNDEVSLKTHLLSDGFHKPASWSADGPEIPRYAYNGHVSGVSRSNENPAFANIYGYDVVSHDRGIKDATSYVGIVHSEWPHTLRVDDYEKIAKFENGKLEKHDPYSSYENMSLPEVLQEESLKYEDALDASKTRETFRGIYEVLKQRLEKANEKYKTQEEEMGRSL